MITVARKALVAGAAELGLTLTDRQLQSFELLAEELKKWNRKINLTAIADDAGIAVKHFVDSLTLFKVVPNTGRLLDIGSGGGFPCLPLKICAPLLEVVSVDAVVKKISFQKHAARELGLSGFVALHARAEALAPEYGGTLDWIVSRAFSDLPSFVAMALPLLKEGGRIVAMKGREGAHEAEEGKGALAELGAEVLSVEQFTLPQSGDERSLVVIGRRV